MVGAFRADVARAGLTSEAGELVDELRGASAEFDALWRDNDVLSHADAGGTKRLQHPELGLVELEHSAFSVDGRPDLGMIVYTPVDSAVARRIRELAAARSSWSPA